MKLVDIITIFSQYVCERARELKKTKKKPRVEFTVTYVNCLLLIDTNFTRIFNDAYFNAKF